MREEADSLIESFRRYFKVGLAISPEQKQDVYGIRYRVYCEEFQYEDADQFPDNMEYDVFDEHALHGLITHIGTGRPAGCVRLVPGKKGVGVSNLPLETYCADSLNKGFIEGLKAERSSMCEISRLAVDGAFRRRAGEAITRFGEVDAIDCSLHERRTFSFISVAAFLAATAMSELSGCTNVFAMMEPFLPRLLKRSGIDFLKVGCDIDYHGIRAPYFSTLESALRSMEPGMRELYEPIYDDMEAEYQLITSGSE